MSHSLTFVSKLSFPPFLVNCFAGFFSPPDHPYTSSNPLLQEVRRREPCFVCGLPVFLAQRLIVGGHLYHRTCFRCARCSAQLTLANSYETQDGAYCCETCPDEEMAPQDIGDKGGGSHPSSLYIEHEANSRLAEISAAEDKTDSLVTSRTASLVGLRRMMFENIAHTDEENSSVSRKISDSMEYNKPCDVKNGQPNKMYVSDKRPVEFGRNSSRRLSNHSIGNSDSSVNKQIPCRENESVLVENYSGISKSDKDNIKDGYSDAQSDLDSLPLNKSDVSVPEILVSSQHSEKEDKFIKMEIVNDKDELSIVNMATDSVLAENTSSDFQSKLDCDSDLELNSCSSDASLIQAKNDVLLIPGDDIEYMKLTESKESIAVNDVVEAKNDVVIEDTERSKEHCPKYGKDQVVNVSEIETAEEPIEENIPLIENLLNKSKIELSEDLKETNDAASRTDQEKTVENQDEDEFTSLTNNIEKLVIDAKNDEVILVCNENVESIKSTVNESNTIAHEAMTPVPIARTVKHKPPTPQRRKVHKVPERRNEEKPGEEYPEELNPFGSDDEVEVRKEKPLSSTNPFGSSDEDEEDSKSQKNETEEIPKPAQRRLIPAPKVSLNPFWSDDEQEEEEYSTPIPKPRKLHTPGPTPEPSPQLRRLRPATGSLGSSTSIASRKKKPAPLPPNLQTLPSGSRKSYSAPQPPSLSRTVTPSPPPLPISSPPASPLMLEKEDKEFYNHRRQNSIVSESSSIGTISSYTPNKSMYGQWKRKKGPAPPLPVPVRRAIQPVPLASIRQELTDIEIKQQGLERQGVRLEQTIRDNFEQAEGASLTPHVEEMVLQLFELVNEKNELFRRQAELMYMRRQHNLEEEHAELEYQIRCLMLCPERNKTDSDKAREEQLIQRLVEVVERRNEIIDCLEMDRLREKEEDQSVGTQLGIFSAAMGSEVDLRAKSDKKNKKAKKEKRWSKKDVDKDVEVMGEKKKIKKKWFTLHHSTSKS